MVIPEYKIEKIGELNRFKYPSRLVSYSDMRDRLRALERTGVSLPILASSVYSPEYQGKDFDGNEVYQLGLRTIKVPAGSLIDSHGNIVDFHDLEKRAAVVKRIQFNEGRRSEKERYEEEILRKDKKRGFNINKYFEPKKRTW